MNTHGIPLYFSSRSEAREYRKKWITANSYRNIYQVIMNIETGKISKWIKKNP